NEHIWVLGLAASLLSEKLAPCSTPHLERRSPPHSGDALVTHPNPPSYGCLRLIVVDPSVCLELKKKQNTGLHLRKESRKGPQVVIITSPHGCSRGPW
ncbi:hypothetical protein B296_00005629, partial [Ensete ventricosum]